MAMKPCLECKKEVSTEAKSCPHCGKVAPTTTSARRILVGVLVGVMSLGIFVAVTSGGGPSVIASIPIQSGVTMAQYQRLQTGMTYAETVAVLGRPGQEMSRTEIGGQTSAMYSWTGTGGISNMTAMFQNDRLVSKAQLGLQ